MTHDKWSREARGYVRRDNRIAVPRMHGLPMLNTLQLENKALTLHYTAGGLMTMPCSSALVALTHLTRLEVVTDAQEFTFPEPLADLCHALPSLLDLHIKLRPHLYLSNGANFVGLQTAIGFGVVQLTSLKGPPTLS